MRKRNPKYEEENITNVTFDDPKFYSHLKNKKHSNQQNITNVLYLLALCHTIVIDEADGQHSYNSSSPDELALVNAAKFFGIKFKGRDASNNILIESQSGVIEKFKLLDLIEFTSTRQRMSIIVQLPDGKIKLLCKGSDTAIGERLCDTVENAAVMT